jgi:hypothetical protein
MTTSCELTDCELSDAELDQVVGGNPAIIAGVVVGAALGVVCLAGALAVVDVVSHHTGGPCVWDALGVT